RHGCSAHRIKRRAHDRGRDESVGECGHSGGGHLATRTDAGGFLFGAGQRNLKQPLTMFFAQLNNELWKLFGKKRTYIGFGAFVLAQAAMLLIFKNTRWEHNLERMLEGNGYLASEYISALTVALIMLFPQAVLLMPLYVALVGGDLVAKEAED